MENVKRIFLEEHQMEIALIGTMHVSQDSASAVRQLIMEEGPDTVCVELDESRMGAMAHNQDSCRGGHGANRSLERLLESFQKQIGDKMNTAPGADFSVAIESARTVQARVVLIDRDIRTTLDRMWKALGPFGKLRFFFYLVREMRQARLMKQEELESLTEQQEVFEALEELAERFPALKRTLVDERDAHMAARIKECGGKKVVVVLGAGHLLGVTRLLQMAP